LTTGIETFQIAEVEYLCGIFIPESWIELKALSLSREAFMFRNFFFAGRSEEFLPRTSQYSKMFRAEYPLLTKCLYYPHGLQACFINNAPTQFQVVEAHFTEYRRSLPTYQNKLSHCP